MTRTLPHDPYITAVVDALTTAGLEPTTAETRDTEENRFAPDTGAELDALLVWDGDTAGLNTDAHEDGIVLLWEHPAEQWQWAPRKQHGELKHEPEFLPLHRWADPAAIVDVVRVLLAGLPAPGGQDPRLWLHFVSAHAAVDAWEATEAAQTT
ncbi:MULTISPECIES: hypothetical protein [Streptomyces]|uniref:hypothetical protein n=1 Tax=Streptomyces TaxID=1883 RepID=UPI0029A8CA30|nr:hypothetical protein [Streptomyces stelliscabiei]MDX2520574.1 hypothetical protein [Streptomyces stelliscabiei]MDX2552671.1 hypothetical protein [Streptomyces stelliscabiei]MDX2661355.1 hypothetical protein [Streptomyces stelliscabiei]MDX2788836.1 hypothetical protein [Streptomyces stelliscabiei]